MTFKNKITTKFISLMFGLIGFLFSCEKEVPYQSGSLSIDDISSVYYAEESISFQTQAEGLSKIIWQISDGSVYEGNSIQHIFDKTGTFQIKLTGYENNLPVDSTAYFVNIKYKSRTHLLDKNFYAIRGTVINSNDIVLEGVFEGENTTKFMKFDMNLYYSGMYDSPEAFDNDIFDNIQLGDEVFSLNNDNYVVKEELVKSSPDFTIPETYFSQEILKYASGVVHYHHDNQSNFLIDYYNSDYTKLWTKTFSGSNRAEQKFVFNNQDKLYYLSFEDNGDKLYIEKFKNVSLYYESKSFELGIDASEREILFAVYKPYTKTVDLAVYSHKTGSTYFFSINEDCELSRKGKIDNYINGRASYTLTDGSTFVKHNNKLTKFDNTWAISREMVIEASYFDMFQLGDNKYLICETLNNKLRLSFVDKHLNQIVFE